MRTFARAVKGYYIATFCGTIQIGWLMLMPGQEVFHTRFDEQGQVVVADIPAALLAMIDAPDLVVGI